MDEPNVGSPWFYSYKRDVWTHLYDRFIQTQAEKSRCTVFYEYVYPSWRPVFDHLGPELASRLKAQLAAVLSPEDADINLLIVAHSMGGLVARSAIQHFDTKLHDAFQTLVTWGSPHRGSALSSLCYVLNSPISYSPYSDGTVSGLAPLLRYGAFRIQMDTPGARDLRWDNQRPMRLNELFAHTQNHTGLMAEFRLDKGTRIYNERLRLFNESDVYGTDTGSDVKNKFGLLKYFFGYGITSNTATGTRSLISLGATVERLLIKNPEQVFEDVHINEGDGAVTLTSIAAEGLAGYRGTFGDVNHEEYFGAPTKPIEYDGPSTYKPENVTKAKDVADLTLNWLLIGNASYRDDFKFAPFISSATPTTGTPGTSVIISGRSFDKNVGAATVTFNGQPVTQVEVRGCNEIQVTVPQGATTGDLVVQIGGVRSNAVVFTVPEIPVKTTHCSCQVENFVSASDGNPARVWSTTYSATGKVQGTQFYGQHTDEFLHYTDTMTVSSSIGNSPTLVELKVHRAYPGTPNPVDGSVGPGVTSDFRLSGGGPAAYSRFTVTNGGPYTLKGRAVCDWIQFSATNLDSYSCRDETEVTVICETF